MTVGDGTWDFTKNTFLLPNLVGLNFETMRYNGMGNRFATVAQYHSLVTGHGVLAAITFLFLVPIAIMYARFHPDRRKGRRIHAYMQVLSVLLSTAVFILGFFAVGPSRSLTNPHHGIGVAIYVLIIIQAIGGSFIRKIFKKSVRLMAHRWFGAVIGILGVVQIPLGLTLYGSPKFTFILYALWVGFLVFLYFILSWRHENDWDDNMTLYGGRSYGGRSESGVTQSDRRSGAGFGWLGPLVAGVGAFTLLRGRKRGNGGSRSRSNSHSPSRSGRTPEVVPSRRASTSYYMGTEKYSDRTDRQGGGIMNKLLAIGGVVGAGALLKKLGGRKEREREWDEEYSSVAPDTPSRRDTRPRPPRKRADDYTESEFTEDRTELAPRPRTPLLPGPGNAGAASSAAGPRPSTPRASHARTAPSGVDSYLYSDYSSYVSPSRRPREDEQPSGGAGKGLLAALGLGWFTRKLKENRDKKAYEEKMRLEEERRAGQRGSRYTGDGYGSPSRPSRNRPPVGAPTTTILSDETESSNIEQRPQGTSLGGPPMPPLAAGSAPPGAAARTRSRSASRPRHGAGPVSMPPMPADPHGLLHSLQPSENESYVSGGRARRSRSERRRRDPEEAAAAAASSAAGLAAEEERERDHSRVSAPASVVKVKLHDDRDRNVTLRRLTEDEARREQRRSRSASVSSLSGSEAPGRRRYRRDGSARRTADETEAERLVPEPLAPTGQRGKDSAYYSGQPGPSGGPPAGAPTVSSIESHGTWSALSPTPSVPTVTRAPGSVAPSAAERRQRRRQERNREAGPRSGTVDYS